MRLQPVDDVVRELTNSPELTCYDSLLRGTRDVVVLDSKWCLNASASTRYHMMVFLGFPS